MPKNLSTWCLRTILGPWQILCPRKQLPENSPMAANQALPSLYEPSSFPHGPLPFHLPSIWTVPNLKFLQPWICNWNLSTLLFPSKPLLVLSHRTYTCKFFGTKISNLFFKSCIKLLWSEQRTVTNCITGCRVLNFAIKVKEAKDNST